MDSDQNKDASVPDQSSDSTPITPVDSNDTSGNESTSESSANNLSNETPNSKEEPSQETTYIAPESSMPAEAQSDSSTNVTSEVSSETPEDTNVPVLDNVDKPGDVPQEVVGSNFVLPPQTSTVTPASTDLIPPVIKNKKSLLKVLLVALIGVFILGGASAAAYFAVIVPNQPESILKTAIANTLQEKQVSYTGTLTADPTSATSGIAAKVAFNGNFDEINKASDTNINVTVSGVSIGGEVRYVGQNLYVKLGDLSTLVSLANSFDPSLGSAAQSASSQLSNKWVSVDSTVFKQASLSCLMDSNDTLGSSDIHLLESLYTKNQFVSIQKTSNDTIGGKSADKLTINVSDDKAANYFNNLGSLSVVKTITSCQKLKSANLGFKGDHKTTAMTVWVDKTSKRIVQFELDSSAKINSSVSESGTVKVALTYKPVTVTAPTNAEPVLNVLTSVEKSLGLSNSSGLNINRLLKSPTSSSLNNSLLQ